MLIKLNTFKGMAPAIDAPALADNAAQEATNVDFSGGTLRSLLMPELVDLSSLLAHPGHIKSIYRYIWNGVSHWLKWTGGVTSVCLSPVPDDNYGRVFWTTTEAGIPPQHAFYSSIVAGSDFPAISYTLGIDTPASFTATANNGNATVPIDNTLDETRSYVVTFVEETFRGSNAPSFEGAPSAPSNMVTVSIGGSVVLTGIPNGADNNNLIAFKRLYRTNTGSSGTGYQLVAEIPVTQNTYTDSAASLNSDLAEILPTEGWLKPPNNLQGLISLPSGALAGFAGNTVYFSVPYVPTAWKADYDISLDFPIVSIACYGTGILVLTKGNPYIINGVIPGTMGYERLELGTACVSGQAVVDFGDTIVYPSTRGLMAVGVQGVRHLTEGLVNQQIWQSLHPETAIAAKYDSFYIVWTSSHKIMIDTKTGNYSLHDIGWTPDCLWTDPVDGTLYMAKWYSGVASSLYKWGTGAVGVSVWKSKRFRLPMAENMAAARVIAESYVNPLICKIYADGVLKHIQAVTSTDPFRLPSGFMARDWEVEITTSTTIYEVAFATSIGEVAV